ncbi:MAG: transposase [Candidatus Beckwithbacteria bacterium]|nr:transposase [Patescibacteria group bacterium]
MPPKNALKYYKAKSYYHIYNRGVAKQNIFNSEKDYKVFLSYLKIYLTPEDLQGQSLQVAPSKQLKNYSETVNLLVYCLMPNHYHLLIFQKEKYNIADLMRSIGTKYSMYFNRTFKRTGPVFESRYKAVRIIEQNHLVYLSKYIHQNPLDVLPARTVLAGYKYSSYGNYLGKFSQSWVKPKKILDYFDSVNKLLSYKEFVEKFDDDLKGLQNKLIDN